MKLIFTLLVSLLSVFGTKASQQPLGSSVVYEMNVRQYTPAGTFAAAEEQLPRLKELGVDVIWLMPIHKSRIRYDEGFRTLPESCP